MHYSCHQSQVKDGLSCVASILHRWPQRPQDPTLSTTYLEISGSMKCSSWEILKGLFSYLKGKIGEGAQCKLEVKLQTWARPQLESLFLPWQRPVQTAETLTISFFSWCLQGLEYRGWHPLCVPRHAPLTLCPPLTVPFLLFRGT